MTLPLALFAPRTRMTAVLAVAAGSLLPRLGLHGTAHPLPTADARAHRRPCRDRGRSCLHDERRTAVILAVAVALGGGCGDRSGRGTCRCPPLLFLGKKTGLPVDLDIITGRMTVDEYVAENIPAAAALAAASTLLAPDTPVGYIGKWEGAQIYTEARLTYSIPILWDRPRRGISLTSIGWEDSEEILASLDQLGLHYFIWERTTSRPDAWRSTLLSTDFLRSSTRVLAGDGNDYLFEVLPEKGEGWGKASRIS